MTTEVERLLVRLETNQAQFDKQMKRMARETDRRFEGMKRSADKGGFRISKALARAMAETDREFERMEREFRGSMRTMERDAERSSGRISRSLAKAREGVAAQFAGVDPKRAVAGTVAVGGLVAAGAARAAQQAATAIAEVGREAERAGVAVEQFQQLRFIADRQRVPVDAMIDALKELNLRADEFVVTGKGPAADAFARMGYTANELAVKLRDPSALFDEIIGKLGDLDRAAQIRVADEIFGGTGGERMVELIDLGADGLAQMRREANDVGLVFDQRLVTAAEDLERRFANMKSIVGAGLKRAIVEASISLVRFIENFREIEERSALTLRENLGDLLSKRDDLVRRLERTGGNAVGFEIDTREGFGALRAELAETERAIDGIREAFRDRGLTREGFMPEVKEQASEARPEVEGLGQAMGGLAGAGASGAKGLDTFADAVRELRGMVPELAEDMRRLNKEAKIANAYEAAMRMASGPTDRESARLARDRALTAVNTDHIKPLEGLSKSARDLDVALRGMFPTLKAVSGYRSPSHNAKVGGAKNSQHTHGNAIDYAGFGDLPRSMKRAILEAAVEMGANGIGIYPGGSLHVDTRDAPAIWGWNPAGAYKGASLDTAPEWARPILARLFDGSNGKGARDTATGGFIPTPDVKGRDDQLDAKADELTRRNEAYRELIASMREAIETERFEAEALGMSKEAALAARIEREMLNDARRAGVKVSAEEARTIAELAGLLASEKLATEAATEAKREKADASRELAEAERAAVDAGRDFSAGVLRGFLGDLKEGKSLAEALANSLNKVADRLLDLAVEQLFSGFGGGGGGGGIFGALFSFLGGGFESGGYTGDRGRKQVAGVVHGQEFVVNAKATANPGVRNHLEHLNRTGKLPGYERGGFVDAGAPMLMPSGPAPVKREKGGHEVIDIHLTDDSGRMAEIADQRIKTKGGQIVNVSVSRARAAVRADMPNLINEAQSRGM